jgi:hypothetical protein
MIHVDTMLDCIGPTDRAHALDQRLQELSVFLSVIMGIAVRLPDHGRAWTWTSGPTAVTDCAVRNLGYFETENPLEMPVRGAARSMPLRPADGPELGIGDTSELMLRADVVDLWQTYHAFPADRRRQFLQAAAKWQEATMHWGERSTLSFALMVVACEVLKPSEPEFRDRNAYDVIEALLGKPTADRLRQHPFAPQSVRNAHLHSGELLGSEFVRMAFMSSYEDPSFDQARRELARLTPAAIIEWLRRGGTFVMPTRKRRKKAKKLGKGPWCLTASVVRSRTAAARSSCSLPAAMAAPRRS